jgi:FlaA1/EpsC-like NDP-sugar epimerase
MLWQAVLAASIAWCAAVFILGQAGVPRSSAVIFTITAPMLVVLLRHMASRYLLWAGIPIPDTLGRPIRKKAIVLGSGRLAVRYLESDLNSNTSVVALIDGSSTQVGRSVRGIRVQHWDRLSVILDREQVAEAIIAADDLADPQLVDSLKFLRAKGIIGRVYTEIAVSQDPTRKRVALRWRTSVTVAPICTIIKN